MFKSTMLIISLLLLSGCQYLGKTVTETAPDGTVTRYAADAYAQKVISESKVECSVKVSDLAPESQRDYMLLAAAGSAPDLCPEGNKGMNYFDSKAAIAKSRHGLIGTGLRVAGKLGGIGFVADAAKGIATGIAKNAGDRYTTQIASPTQSASVLSDTGGNSAGSGTVGEELGIPSGDASGGELSGGSGVRANTINIGGNVAVSGDRAAAGETALVNGDSSVISSVEDAEVKGTEIAEDINKPDDQSQFSDDDGGNGVFDL